MLTPDRDNNSPSFFDNLGSEITTPSKSSPLSARGGKRKQKSKKRSRVDLEGVVMTTSKKRSRVGLEGVVITLSRLSKILGGNDLEKEMIKNDLIENIKTV